MKLELADQIEAMPLDRGILAERFRQIALRPADVFLQYHVGSVQRIAIVEQFLDRADDVDPAVVC